MRYSVVQLSSSIRLGCTNMKIQNEPRFTPIFPVPGRPICFICHTFHMSKSQYLIISCLFSLLQLKILQAFQFLSINARNDSPKQTLYHAVNYNVFN